MSCLHYIAACNVFLAPKLHLLCSLTMLLVPVYFVLCIALKLVPYIPVR